jgi:hypothetical protein
MKTSSPCVQLTGVATGCAAVSWSESSSRSPSSKFRPLVIGYVNIADEEHRAHGAIVGW